MENRFSVGAVLGTGFKIWFKNLPAFLLITIVQSSIKTARAERAKRQEEPDRRP